jgi:glycosyltransferase involved in cell wall biosynthesis
MSGGRTCIFTIASRNYTHATRTLMEGVARHAPDAHRVLALCDKRGDFDFSRDDFEVLELSQIPLPDKPRFLFQYSLLELNTAIKPFVIELLFARGFENVIYFDPDIAIHGSLDEMLRWIENANILLTPHITAPIDDGKIPAERNLLSCGTCNLGFAAFHQSDQTQKFIGWWKSKLTRDCVVDFRRGLFVDQKWMEFAPSFCDRVQIVRHPGWNVAYWNLPTRAVMECDGGFTVNGEPLVFFHFSGFDADRGVFGKHQTRYTLDNIPPAVATLAERYTDDVRRNGLADTKRIPYAHGKFADGTPVPDLARKIFREGGDELAARFPDPAGADSAAFIRFVNEPFVFNGRSSPFVTRIMREVFHNHPDLFIEEQFPDVLGVHARSFAEWFAGPGREFHKLPDAFVQPARDALSGGAGSPAVATSSSFSKWIYQMAWRFKDLTHAFIPLKTRQKIAAALFRRAYVNESSETSPSSAASLLPRGVNVIGYLRAELGVGEAARATLRACKAAGIETAAIDFTKGVQSRLDEKVPGGFATDPKFGVTLLHLNAEQVPYAVADLEAAMKGRYNIAFWNWELPELPDSWLECTQFLDEVWAPSQFCATAFGRKLKIPVAQIPYAIDVEVPPGIGRRELGVPEDGFVFLYMFDALSVPQRKNPMAVVEAYLRARPSLRGKTHLVLKMINGEKETGTLKQLRAAMDREPSIVTIDRYLRRPELNALFNAADCYVSLHRSEGFGLTLAESMFLGKPVIATGWSSNMDFMTPWNSIPVPYRLVQLDQDYGPYPRGQWWADPDVDAAATAMIRVANEPDFGRALGAKAAEDIRTNFSPAAVGAIIRGRLDAIRHRA